MLSTKIQIDGMACTMCEAHVNDAVRRAVPGVTKLRSSYKKGETSFVTETTPDAEALREAIEKTGYRVLSLETAPYVKKGIFG